MSRQLPRRLPYAGWYSSILVYCVCILIAGVFNPTSTMAGGRIIKEDSDGNGRTDRIVHLAASGDVIKLEADTNGDCRMDTFQYYRCGMVGRIERDSDADGHINERDMLKNGKTVIRQALNSNGEIVSILTFDGEQRPLAWRRDTTGDGRMDTVYQYEGGKPRLVTRDTTGDGRVNVRQRFRNGESCEYSEDSNGDGVFDVLVRMSKDRPVTREEDTNHDGRMDRFTDYDDRGRPVTVREFAADPDEPVKITRFRDGELCRVEQTESGRSVFTDYEKNKPVKQAIDADRDGRPEQFFTYGTQGGVESAFSDTNRDGRIDTWQYYRDGVLYRAEQDRNHDGKVDARLAYDDGRNSRTLVDDDGDGHFEARTAFDTPEWSRVTERVDTADRLLQRLSYSGEVLRKKEDFTTATGRLARLEEFDRNGKILMTREAENGSAALNLTWRYDAEENAVAAERDSDGDGETDIWYFYENGCVKRIEEDRNRDGKPDLWETYDAAQVVVCKREDLDFDGTVDIERRF